MTDLIEKPEEENVSIWTTCKHIFTRRRWWNWFWKWECKGCGHKYTNETKKMIEWL